MKSKLINVIGLGYVGLPTALLMSENYKVIGTDKNEKVVQSLNNGTYLFNEQDLQEYYHSSLKCGIEFTTEYKKADIYIVAVPTPFVEETKKINPEYLLTALKEIKEVCPENAIIVIESTIAPGTIDKYVKPLFLDKKVKICHAPERVLPGNIIQELKNNSRTIGSDEVSVSEEIKKIYHSFCNGEIISTDICTAEISKVIENTYRDINIAYANELKKICTNIGLDTHEVIRIANFHPRVNILNPGSGVGGHCISVDPWFLVGEDNENTPLIQQARNVNDSMPNYIWKKMQQMINNQDNGQKKIIGLYGLTYKPNVDDIRESPALQLHEQLNKQERLETFFFDPLVSTKVVENQIDDFDQFLDLIDILLIFTPHDHIKKNCINVIQKKVQIFDTSNTFKQAVQL
ncbi:TPA: nucleotide sugar dehydrogenase [Enterococcus faecalis]|nr:nucleotide sugar dehydrogenase [Enterococcus faecalis]HBI1551738.1 nucleotide sugar dehydrogenase [Enterococcus faecalis]HBI1773175.1 nucleotide sugar dehydrogenase [Enterococcus faecalis]HBI1794887.1 nucleotide sugar dehydrogenase [Enterococcus faecalis]HBI1803360.1 nucleotide sugar dehydrogenase [Enterococcus faecalis]